MENPGNLVIVIFGASGDLTSRKLIPAIFSLKSQNLMPEKYAILGVGRTKLSTEDFRIKMSEAIISYSEEKVTDKNIISSFTGELYYHSMDNSIESEYTGLKSFLEDICKSCSIGGNYIFYMATPPSMYEIIAVNLARAGLTRSGKWFQTGDN